MSRSSIVIRGARENNLKNVSVNIPKHQITVFTGVSGSGKSSLVFDTVAAEAQRQLNETFTAFARGFLPSFPQPELDSIENLSAPVIIDQKALGGNSRSTIGTISDVNPLLRVLFSRLGEPHVGNANVFSFNDPQGMCPECDGIGVTSQLILERFIDPTLSLNGGALLHPDFRNNKGHGALYTASGYFDNDKPINEYTPEEHEKLMRGTGKVKVTYAGNQYNSTYEGLLDKFTRSYIKKDSQTMSDRNRAVFETFVEQAECPACGGSRYSELARSSRVEGYSIDQLLAMEVERLVEVLRGFTDPAAAVTCNAIIERLDNMVTIGLGYLSLDRATSTMSGGESQRIKMVRHLNSSLTDMLYILDEPSAGLHARDVDRLNTLIRKLRDKGNTVLVVEHDRDVIAIADHIIDVGPHAGKAGGEIVYEGPLDGLRQADTLTGRHLAHRLPLKTGVLAARGSMAITDATLHNLKNVSTSIPEGVLTVVTGVAGSGKSSLINDVFLRAHPDAVVISQGSVTRSRRSNTATYTGILDDIRKLFAKATGASPSLFSANSKGACPTCQGLGVVYTEMAFLDDIRSVCEVCEGRRFTDEVLELTLREKSISDVLRMTTTEAAEFFHEKGINRILTALVDVGLGYLQLGQPLNTVSGGEGQRLKLATELHKKGSIYVMDEPTTGLHMSDIGHILGIIDRLVDQGNTVVVIEHDLDVIKNADWIIDLGPEAGRRGGEIVFEGTPAQLIESKDSLTAEYIRRDLAGVSPTM